MEPRTRPTADLAIVGCTALVDADGSTVGFRPGTVIEITNGVITRLDDDATRPASALETIDANGQVAMPGLINTHTHAAMTFFRGAAEDVAVGTWFNDLIWPMEVNLTPRDVYLGTLVAAAEMIECGVTTFNDMYFHMDDAARAVDESGLRAVLGWNYFSSQGAEGIATTVGFAERWNRHGRITTTIAPHAPYTVSDADLTALADEARRLDVKVHLHAAEDIAQTRSSLASRRITPIRVLAETGVLDAGCIIAHGNGIVDDDVELLAAHADRVGVTHGPKGYLKFALGPLTPIAALRDAGVAVGYCTDGPASNNTLDILESMRITSISQKQVADDATWFTSALALHLAGPGSARVIGRADDLGALHLGAAADIILVDVSGFHCQPTHDLAAVLVHSLQPGDVRTTIVDGQVLMHERELRTIDRTDLLTEFRQRARDIVDRSHGRTIQDYAP